jgi:hypothetical protein
MFISNKARNFVVKILHICAVAIFVSSCTFGLIVRKAAPGEQRLQFDSVFGQFPEEGGMMFNEIRSTNAEQ